MAAGFTRAAAVPIYEGHVVSLQLTTVEGPDHELFDREVVTHAGAVAVVPLHDDGVVMVRQYRAAVDAMLLEIPAGKRDVAGEPPDVTARRELEEEIGMRAGELEPLAAFYNSPGFCDELTHLYVARDLTATGRSAQGVEEEYMSVVHVPLSAIDRLIADGEICDAKTLLGLMFVRRSGA